MGRKPDLTNEDHDLAVWIDETSEGQVKLNIQKDGDYAGTVVDFDEILGFRSNWYVYIIKCKKTRGKNRGEIKYYTGQTWNLEKRFREHKLGVRSNWMKNNNFVPLKVVYFEMLHTESESLEREQQIKNWGRDKKIEKATEFLKEHKDLIERRGLANSRR